MSIFTKAGVVGQIKTTHLPSGDMAVSGPSSGPLEQIMYDVCHWSGRRNPDYGGWIVPRNAVNGVLSAFGQRCDRTSS